MYWLRFTRLRLEGLLRKEREEEELDAELRFHLMMRAQENMRGGMTPEGAEAPPRGASAAWTALRTRPARSKEAGC